MPKGCYVRHQIRVKRHQVIQPDDPTYRLIPLTRGQNALVDTEDYEWLSKFNWKADWSDHTKSFYATRTKEHIAMHREILKVGARIKVDHRNHDTLDNRKKNLRKCTNAQNLANMRKRISRSGFKGVHFHKRAGKYIVRIRGRHVGCFVSAEDAARAYNSKASELFGEFASLNKGAIA